MSRYYPQSAREAWDSYEWLLKDHLKSIDSIARNMYSEIMLLRQMKAHEIREFMQQNFARLWEEVAEEGEA